MLDKILELDGQILLWIQENVRSDFFTPLVKGITYLGNGGALMIAAALALMLIPKTRRLGFLCASALLVNVVINNLILKNAIARTRPYEVVEGLRLIIGRQSDYSFPSGHTTAGFSVASVIFMETRRRIGVPVVILALMIALSRLYVGVHYPTDVLVGIISGTLIGVMTCVIYHRLIVKNRQRLHR